MVSHFSLLFLSLPLVVTAALSEPCALITRQINLNKSSTTSDQVFIPAQLAEDCLESMPFYPELAASFIDEITKYIQWQSTLEALKNPPDTYMSSSTDILGGLKKIRKTNYSSQWEFDREIAGLIKSANDGHFYVTLCSSGIFSFIRKSTPIVSVSKNGLDAPEIYTFTDAISLNDTKVKVSPITSIDGKDPLEYIRKIADPEAFQDPDARHNKVFYSVPGATEPLAFGSFYRNPLYSGRNTTSIKYRNGTTAEIPNMASVLVKNFDALDGKDLFDRYCLPKTTSSSPNLEPTLASDSNASQGSIKPPLEAGPAGYPEPYIRDPYNQIVGYVLDKETVVMRISSFDNDQLPDNQTLVFAEYATELVSRAVENGHSKIIIDISSNYGGTISRAFDLFKLFFPSELPYSATRFRRHTASEGVTKAFSIVNESLAWDYLPFAYTIAVTPDQEEDFTSYEDFLGNKTEWGVKTSSLFANFNYTLASSRDDSLPIRGYSGRPLSRDQPFKTEDILIIGDGICVSTCTTFVNLMTNVGGVQALSFGGRPDDQPMQIMGGVRGAQSFGFDAIYGLIEKVQSLYSSYPNELDSFSREEITEFLEAAPKPLGELPLVLESGGINLRNAYQEGEDDLPLQFQYQAADCRLYYTAENVFRPETTWKSAKNAIWANGSCIDGSTGGTGSLQDKTSKKNESETSGSKGKEGSDGEGTKGDSSSKAPTLIMSWNILGAVMVMAMVSL
ncbi:hypothetical protein NW762_014110 [Fusarium torreyae]|uniref:CPAF-like PDZ domain-containing protein n=1 Tax=Fusarium torreyae TaxID=1237075 RepID=A0A9W8RM38_9HYPO|nr:hypothetical protein NW762_014110 [Fusarium torreyae]